MYEKNGNLPQPLQTKQELGSLDAIVSEGDSNETPFNVFIGHNLGHRVFTLSIPFRKFHDISDVANDRDVGPVAQRALDPAHAKKLAAYMIKGLVSAAMLRREALGKEVPPAFGDILKSLGGQPYFSIQPLVCNIRNVPLGGIGAQGIRGIRLETTSGETAAFRVFLSERHVLWVIDGQHRREGADMTMKFLEQVRTSGKYPGKGSPVQLPDRDKEVSEGDMLVWNEAYDAARSYATLSIEIHLGLDIDQERQLFHDLNRLTKKVDPSLALQFDTSNPIAQFIKNVLACELVLHLIFQEVKEWSQDKGELVLKDIVAVNAIAFLNKGNIAGATPAVVEPRQPDVLRMWEKISEIPDFGCEFAKERTIAAQPVVLKALAKISYDLKFSNRRPENGDALFEQFLEGIPKVDFSHNNPVWRYYTMTSDERSAARVAALSGYLPADDPSVNRDLGSLQGGFMRFGAKHNDIYPILADMIRWQIGLPSRRDD
jgi:hypothetical protein